MGSSPRSRMTLPSAMASAARPASPPPLPPPRRQRRPLPLAVVSHMREPLRFSRSGGDRMVQKLVGRPQEKKKSNARRAVPRLDQNQSERPTSELQSHV